MDILFQIQNALSFAFIQRAVIAGSLIALTCACLGPFLILRRLSLIGDGLAHVAFAAVALGLLLHAAPLFVALPVVVLASLAILELTERGGIYNDTALGLISSVAVAFGVLLASVGGGFNVDLFSYLFGSILTVSWAEVLLAFGLSVSVGIAMIVMYHDLFCVAFDEESAKASGVRVRLVNRILVALTAATVVLGIKLVGTMLVSSLIILPAATALQIAGGFRQTIIMSALLALGSVLSGILVSYLFNLPSGATIVLLNFLLFLTAFGVMKNRR